MGNSNSKQSQQSVDPKGFAGYKHENVVPSPTSPERRKHQDAEKNAKPQVKKYDPLPPENEEMAKYIHLRDDLFAFSLGEAAYDYAQRLNRDSPDNPAVMALLGETCYLYDKLKVKGKVEYWEDRMDVLQKGLDVTNRCINENPNYAPCYRSYTLVATKMADTDWYLRRWKAMSDMKHYQRIYRKGAKCCELVDDAEVIHSLATLTGRCATNMVWNSPWKYYAWWMGLPSRNVLLERTRDLHLQAYKIDPESVENCARLGQVYWELGDSVKARRWLVRARDELVPRDAGEDSWQMVAHTHLCTMIEKAQFNVPFG